MPARSSAVLLIISILSVFHLCYADLPIHCLQHQVVGQWKLLISEPKVMNNHTEMSCGHSSPDNPADSYLANRNTFKPSTEFFVSLADDAKVAGKKGESGTWTMIYDEAVDILLDNNHRFTAFFDYYPDENGKVMSYCGRTVVGWYQNLISGTRACFKAEKQLQKGEKEEDLNGVPLVQMHVVQPDETHSLLQIGYTSRQAKKLRSIPFTKDFKAQQYIVDQLNKIPSKSWNARVYPQFEGKSFVQLNQFVGRSKSSREGQRPSLQNSFIQTVDVSDLPKEFTWKDYISPPRSQGSCGSCYVFSTLAMLEARLRIKYDKDVHLSVQHVLDCSFYNQGCKGGYPFLVEKYATDFELVPEDCSPYQAQTGTCGTCNTKSLNEVYRATNYKFIGGAYGKSNEREMMLEVMENGPIVVSFEPTSDFMQYGSGVYHNVDPEWLQSGQEKPEWERVDHSVMLYGWGETEEGEKYWTIMNSWGEDWGESGSFRMRRGNDECAVESMGEAADPVIIKQTISA